MKPGKPILPPFVRYGVLLVGLALAIAVNTCGNSGYRPLLEQRVKEPEHFDRWQWWMLAEVRK